MLSAYCSISKFLGLGWEGMMFGFAFNVLFTKWLYCFVLLCRKKKVLCMHIFNKAFRVLKKKKMAHGSLKGAGDCAGPTFGNPSDTQPSTCADPIDPESLTWQSMSQGLQWKTLGWILLKCFFVFSELFLNVLENICQRSDHPRGDKRTIANKV